MKEFPKNIIADTLNAKLQRMDRSHRKDDKIPRQHVSSIIRSDKATFYCPREIVLRYMERRGAGGGGTPPKFELLWATGHFLGEYIVNQFFERNPMWAKYAWGDWKCLCGKSTRTKCLKPEHQLCNHCSHPIELYVECDLTNPQGTVVGHADLIFCIDDYFYIYEFKSINRSDVVFEEINEPLGDHLVQASNYYYMLQSEGHKVSRKIRFVYVDRSMDGLYVNAPYREVTGMAIPKSRLAKFYKRVKVVHDSIKAGRLPRRKCEKIDCTRGKSCSVAVSCFAREKSTVKRIPPPPVRTPSNQSEEHPDAHKEKKKHTRSTKISGSPNLSGRRTTKGN